MSLLTLSWLSGGAAADPEAPNVLLIGVGGGSIVRVLAAALPPAGRVHSLELEPEVLQAAIDFFGFPVSDNYPSAAADGAAHMRTHCAAPSNSARGTVCLPSLVP